MVEPDESGVIPLESGIATVGQIAIVLIGAFPMVTWITRTFGRSLARIGTKLGMDDAGAAGLITTMANNIATVSYTHLDVYKRQALAREIHRHTSKEAQM